MRLTRRGWVAVYAAALIAGFALGSWSWLWDVVVFGWYYG